MKKKTTKELRNFGLVMAGAFAVLGAISYWRNSLPDNESTIWPYMFGLAGFFLVFGLIFPRVLTPIEWFWMKLAFVLSIIVTHILVTLTFYIVITPVGLLMRLFGNDPLRLKFAKKEDSYWVKVEDDGPHTRFDKPY